MQKLNIVELESFKKATKKLLSEEDKNELKKYLSLNAMSGDVIKGSGGLRKARWSTKNNKGERSGGRVIYYYYVIKDTIFLIYFYSKNEKEDLSIREVNIFKNIIIEITNN